MEEAALRAHQSSFLRLKRKLFVLRPVCLLTKHGYLCFSLPPKIDIIVHMDVELNPGLASSSLRSKRKWPYRECRSGRTVKVRKATKVLIFNPTPRRRQFAFHSGRNDNNLVRIPLI